MESTAHKSSSYPSIVLYEAAQFDTNTVVYFDALGNKKTVTDRVKKLKKDEGKTYLVLNNGQEIDFELIYSVDYEVSPNYTNDYFKCDCV